MVRGLCVALFLFLSIATAEAGMKFNSLSGQFDITGEIPPTLVPSNISSVCSKGELSFDTSYLYLCIDTNSWKRVSLSTWAVTDLLLLSDGSSHVLL